jgi:hypothetical protein
MATHIPMSNPTVATLMRRLIVFHFSRWEHPRLSEGVAGPSSSSALYLKSAALNRSDKFDGTRGMIFGRNTMIR